MLKQRGSGAAIHTLTRERIMPGITNVDPAFTQHLTNIIGNAVNQNVPQELQNARPSTSIFSRIGHSIKSFFSAIGSGISAIAARIFVSDTPKPRVNPNSPNALPMSRPADDAANSQLSSGLYQMQIPASHRNALEGTIKNLRERFGDAAPENIDALSNFMIDDNYFMMKLRLSIDQSTEYVSPQRFARLAMEILEPQVAENAIGNVLKARADTLGIPMQGNAVKLATTAFFEANPDLSLNHVSDMKSAQECVAKKETMLEGILKKASITGALEEKTLPPEYKKAMETMLDSLRASFGKDCLTESLEGILKLSIPESGNLQWLLTQFVKENKNPVSPETFAATAKKFLLPLVQERSVNAMLGRMLEEKHGIKPHPKLLSEMFDGVRNILKNDLSNTSGLGDIAKIIVDHEEEVSTAFSEISGKIKSMEEKYLPSVDITVRPILQKIIRSLPWNAEKAEDSEKQIETVVKDMASWKADVAFGDKKTDAWCAKMTEELKLFTNDENNTFVDDIFPTVYADANRAEWNINNKHLSHPQSQDLIADFKTAVPNPEDQHLLSTLSNQYLGTNLSISLNYQWRISDTEVSENECKNGLSFSSKSNPDSFGLLREATGVNVFHGLHADNGSYSITVSPDKKTAVVELHSSKAICTDNKKTIQVGTANHVLRIHCNLSAGSPDGKPSVTKVEISQNLRVEE